MSDLSQGFHHRRTVRFGECDPAGVTYYPVYFDWFHQAMEACFEEYLKVPYAQMIQTVGFPSVQTSATFKRPLPVGEHVSIQVTIINMGRSSIVWKFTVFNGNGDVATVGEVKTVCIAVTDGDFQFSPVEVPESVRSGLRFLIESH